MKSVALLLLLLSACAWTVNPSATFSDVGIDIKVAEQRYLNIFYRLSDGTPHVTFGFIASPGNANPTQIWDLNLSNGTSRVRSMSLGYPPVSSAALTASNTLVIGTSDPGHMSVYDPVSGSTNYIKQCYDRDYYASCVGSDGIVYFGTYPNAGAEQYDPASGTGKSWGNFDTNVPFPSYTYSIGAADGYIYGVIRSSTNWYLGIIEKATTNKTVLWKSGVSPSLGIYKGLNGNWYASQNTNSQNLIWHLSNGVPNLVSSTPLETWYQNGGVNRDQTTWSAEEGWDVETTFDVFSASGSIPSASARWKKSTNSVWQSVSETNGWNLTKGVVDIVQPWTDNKMLWVVNAYGPIGTFIPYGATEVLGSYKGLSTYDVLQVSTSEVYLSGYHLSTLRWNPSLPWTRVPLQDDYTNQSVNPYTAVLSLGKYHYYLARGFNGMIYIGSHHERGSSGGELGWYDPSTGETGSERSSFLNDDVIDLKSVLNGTKLVYVSDKTNIFVWDVNTFTKDTNFTVMGGSQLDKIAEYSPGNLIGISGSKVCAFNTLGSQLYSNNLSGWPWVGLAAARKRLTIGPDGMAWVSQGGNLVRINPETGSYSNVIYSPSTAANVVFNGGDAYLYGGTTVWKASGLLYSGYGERSIISSSVSASVVTVSQ